MIIKFTKAVFFVLALLSLSLGVVGIFIPLLPTVPFLLLAAFLFDRSSPRFHAKLLKHPVLGPPIEDWKKFGVVNRKVKTIVFITLCFSGFVIANNARIPTIGKLTFLVFASVLLAFILSRKSDRNLKL